MVNGPLLGRKYVLAQFTKKDIFTDLHNLRRFIARPFWSKHVFLVNKINDIVNQVNRLFGLAEVNTLSTWTLTNCRRSSREYGRAGSSATITYCRRC